MSFIATKSKFHVALDGEGLILQGAPERPAYQQLQAPLYNTRFGAGDRSYSDFSFWWFWAQTDFSGGYKQQKAWADDAKFLESSGVDTVSKPGSVVLNWRQLNAVTYAKSVVWHDLVPAFGTPLAIGRNDTDGKMLAINSYSGALVWEDSATGANEEILCGETFKDGSAYIGCHTVGSGASMLKVGTGGAFADVGAFTFGAGIWGMSTHPEGDCIYLFTFNAGIYHYNRNSGAFTQKKATYPMGLTAAYLSISHKQRKPVWRVGDLIYFILEETNVASTQLWAYDIGNDAYVQIYVWGAGSAPTEFIARDSSLYFFDRNKILSRIQVWKYDTTAGSMAVLQEVGRPGQGFELAVGTSYSRTNPTKNADYIYFAVDNGDGVEIWQIDRADTFFSGVTPPAAFSSAIDLLAAEGNGNLHVILNGAIGTNNISSYSTVPPEDYQIEGNIVTSVYDGNIPALDKLFYDVTFTFDELQIGEAIEVWYSLDAGETFVFLGQASGEIDGNITSKTILFGDSLVSKSMVLKFVLIGEGDTTPSFNDFSVRLVPFVTYKKLWNIYANCADEVKRLDGRLVETTARELRSRLERAWWTKKVLDFQDLDFAQTTIVEILPALVEGTDVFTDITITVDDTSDFAEQGRLRIGDEEILYQGKTPHTFTGCTRAARETRAEEHDINDVAHNAYRVILTDLKVQLPLAMEDKELEYVVGISMRET